MGKPQLRVLLVATAFLTLAGLIDDIVRQPAIARTVAIIVEAAVEDNAVIAKHAHRQHRLDAAGVPIPIGERGEVLNGRVNGAAQHLLKPPHLSRRPAGIGMADQLGGVDILETTQRRSENFVPAGKLRQRVRPRIHNLHRLFRVRLIAGQTPHQGILICRVAIEIKLMAGRLITIHLRHRPGQAPIRLRLRMPTQRLKPAPPRFGGLRDHFLQAREIRRRVQQTGMHERRRRANRRQPRRQQQQANDQHQGEAHVRALSKPRSFFHTKAPRPARQTKEESFIKPAAQAAHWSNCSRIPS